MKAPVDCRGVEIHEGDTVVTAGFSQRLMEREVTRIERKSSVWVNIWCGGFWTTPDRVAVVSKEVRP